MARASKPAPKSKHKPAPAAKAKQKVPVRPAPTAASARSAWPGPGLATALRDDGTLEPTFRLDLDDERLLYLYRTMVSVREFDRRMLLLQRQGRIGFYGPILGQEAATVGSVAAMDDVDWIFPALREGAAAIMRGLSLELAIAQLIGNAADRCKGRQMPCHYTLREKRYVSMSSVIGTQITHAVGAAMAARIRKDPVVCLGYLGDGATSANDFHAGMNFAAVLRAPVILFCQNNHWAISVPIAAQSASETIAVKGAAYGMHSVRVDGNDVLAVHAVTRAAAERARRGDGPTFVEAVTYRRLGHSSSDDPTRYRDEAEVKAWEKRDPIDRYRRFLEKRRLWDGKREDALQDEIALEVNQAIAAAESHPKEPPADTLITDVFATIDPRTQADFDAAFGADGNTP